MKSVAFHTGHAREGQDKGVEVGPPGGGLRPELCTILKQLARDDPEAYVFKPKANAPKTKISTLGHLDCSSISQRIRSILINAGFTGAKLGSHTLRHSAGSIITKNTKDVFAVKGILGHSDIKTSMMYIHEVEEEAARQISPLQLIADDLTSNSPDVKQGMLLTSGSAIVPTNEPQAIDDIVDSSFPLIPNMPKAIRPSFDQKDMELIRRAFICVSRYGTIINDSVEARALFKRMIRKL